MTGVVVITEFETPDSVSADGKSYSGYLDYQKKKKGQQKESKEFKAYNEYMGYQAKTSGLFNNTEDTLSKEQITDLKKVYDMAQENGSLLWRTVISFDNQWLEKFNLYDFKTGHLNDKKMHEVCRIGINKMLENEGLQNAVWTAGIHYDTDNIHVHVSIVEPIPMRKRAVCAQYTYVKDENGKIKNKIPILDQNGNQVYKEEYIGRFKEKSIQLCKSAITNEIVNQKDINLKINEIIRNRIINGKKDYMLHADAAFRDEFFDIYDQLPNCPKNMWNYKQNIMDGIRPQIDKLSRHYLDEFHKDDMKILTELLIKQDALYSEAYGNSGKNYMQGKIDDLYYRLGNAILKEMRNISDEEIKEGISSPIKNGIDNNKIKNSDVPPVAEKQSPEQVEQRLRRSADQGNQYAQYALGKLYMSGEGVERDPEQAAQWFLKSADQGNQHAQYALGKLYMSGEGVERDPEQAAQWFLKSAKRGNQHAQYALGKLHMSGEGVERDPEQAAQWFLKSADQGNQYAQYSLGRMYYYGIGIKKNTENGTQLLLKSMNQGNICAANVILKNVGNSAVGQISNLKYQSQRSFTKARNDVERGFRSLMKSMRREYETWKNIIEHDKMLNKQLDMATQERKNQELN